MEQKISELISNILGTDKDLRTNSYLELMKITEQKVDWAYEVWDLLVENFNHPNNHTRSIVGQLISNLTKSDDEGRIRQDFPKLIELTKDKMFVTARHVLLSIWKIGLTGENNMLLVLDGLSERYRNCTEEKNWTLIRSDIIQSLKKLYVALGDERISKAAVELIDQESDEKYKKKYTSIWRKKGV